MAIRHLHACASPLRLSFEFGHSTELSSLLDLNPLHAKLRWNMLMSQHTYNAQNLLTARATRDAHMPTPCPARCPEPGPAVYLTACPSARAAAPSCPACQIISIRRE